jgi:hypothetical protein
VRAAIVTGALVCAVVSIPATAEAGPLDDYLARIKKALADAVATNTPKPPRPVAVSWRARRLGAIDLPLLAVEAGDIDGDGTPELVGLTTAEVVVIEITGGKVTIAARANLPAKPALVRSRDPIGSLVIDGAEIAARSSEQEVGGRFRWSESALVAVGEIADFPLCSGISARLASGRNTFDGATAKVPEPLAPLFARSFYSAECRDHIGADGARFSTAAVSDTGRVVRVACAAGDNSCPAAAVASVEVESAGFAFEIADVDRDGRAEVIASRGQAPGVKDRVRAFAHVDGSAKQVFDHYFEGGVVALVAPDLDGDGAREVIAAVRMWRSQRIDLWVLTRPR